MTEFVLAFFENVKGVIIFIYVIVFILGLAGWFFTAMDTCGRPSEEEIKIIRSRRRAFFRVLWASPVLLLTAIPSIDEMWRVRIGLIKYEMASPENIQKGTEEIIRIARKLECKYIGCEEPKTTEGK